MPRSEYLFNGLIEKRTETFKERDTRILYVREERWRALDRYAATVDIDNKESSRAMNLLRRLVKMSHKLESSGLSSGYYLKGRFRIPFLGRNI